MGLSFALALEKVRSNTNVAVPITVKNFDSFAFLEKSVHSPDFWNKLHEMPKLATSQMNLWIVGPGMRRHDYPQQVALSGDGVCTIDTSQHYRIGIPYQLYRCK